MQRHQTFVNPSCELMKKTLAVITISPRLAQFFSYPIGNRLGQGTLNAIANMSDDYVAAFQYESVVHQLYLIA